MLLSTYYPPFRHLCLNVPAGHQSGTSSKKLLSGMSMRRNRYDFTWAYFNDKFECLARLHPDFSLCSLNCASNRPMTNVIIFFCPMYAGMPVHSFSDPNHKCVTAMVRYILGTISMELRLSLFMSAYGVSISIGLVQSFSDNPVIIRSDR